MSWDIFIQDFPENARNLSDVSEDFIPTSIGKLNDLIEKIEKCFEDSVQKNGLITYNDKEWSIDISLGDSEDCMSIMLSVYGNASKAVETVKRILLQLDLKAVDTMTGDFLDVKGLSASANRFNDMIKSIY